MRPLFTTLLILVVSTHFWGALPAAAQESSAPERDEPRDIGLVEQTQSRITQVDVSVHGPADAISALTREDFALVVGSKPIDEFTVDNLCPMPLPEEDDAGDAETTGADEPVTRPKVSFIFFIDQQHLTQRGRANAIFMAEELIRRLIRDGNRGILFSNGKDLKAFTGLTDDQAEILSALGVLDGDKHPDGRQWVPDATAEDYAIDDINRTLRNDGTDRAMMVARQYQKAEVLRARKAQDRLVIALQTIAGVDPPKAVFYFADRMRKRAGGHYRDIFGASALSDSRIAAMENDAFGAAHGFDMVNEEAAAKGIRFHTIFGEGLTAESSTRDRDARTTLQSLAAETGGESFLGTDRMAGVQRVAETVEEDLRCMYLLSFQRPKGLMEDELMALRVELKNPDKRIKIDARGQIIFESRSKRQTARLLAAFVTPDSGTSTSTVKASIVPTGFEDGHYSALFQAGVGGSPLPGAVWDIGLSVVARGKVRQQKSGRIEVSEAGVPVVFEAELEFDHGPYEIIVVAHERTEDRIVRGQLAGSFPDSSETVAIARPIAIVRGAEAAFLRDGEVRRTHSGLLSVSSAADYADPTRTNIALALLCRDKGKGSQSFILRRSLSGENSVEFPQATIEFQNGERCIVNRDTIPPNTMNSGEFTYSIELRRKKKGEPIASAERHFVAVDPSIDPRELLAADPTPQ
ncbi:MAG: hypothetical protein GY716_21010 [bacterium]|nr:hypothetical protein [bacterium]